jgi:polysaccharide deacetylase family protein (PEP-CTERM system associated)
LKGGAAPQRARATTPGAPVSIFSVDVEDWFHVLDVAAAPAFSSWHEQPSIVEPAFQRLLDLFDEHHAQVTCFFLGWVAERYPHLVREAVARGHEVASHGYAHRLVYRSTRQEFFEDASHARRLLEDLAGVPVLGYRSAGFSVTEKTQWFFEALVEAGYAYDSSVFPATRGHGGMSEARREPHRIDTPAGPLMEFPITVSSLLGKPLCFFGGGYLRLFPSWLIRRAVRQVLAEGRPVVFYIHPREIDPSHPRIAMPLQRRFKSYVNLRTTETKLRRILAEFPVTTFRDFMADPTHLREVPDGR